MSEQQEAFIGYLESLDPGGRAVLRRSLAFPPGSWPRAYPYVEPFVRGRHSWDRKAAYLVAGLNATSRAATASGNMGETAARLRDITGSGSIEARFIALLDADADELPHRLRQMVTLMSGHGIAPNWTTLRHDLERWTHPDHYVQQRWARSFYATEAREVQPSSRTGTQTEHAPRETETPTDTRLE